MKTAVFLDIDGVLNCHSTHEKTPDGYTGIEDKKVAILKELTDAVNGEIILTSTWKDCWNTQDNDGRYLDEKLAAYGLSIKESTKDEWENRGAGIVKYMKEHAGEYTGMVILDDYTFDFKQEGIRKYHIETTQRNYGNGAGLMEKHIRMAKKIAEKKLPEFCLEEEIEHCSEEVER